VVTKNAPHTVTLRNIGFLKEKATFLARCDSGLVPPPPEIKELSYYNYIPPERHQASVATTEQGSFSVASDLFSFGILLWELFEGGFVHYFPEDVLCRSSLILKEQRMIMKQADFLPHPRWNVLPLLRLTSGTFVNCP
jgi:hypothetical protein